MSENKNLLSYLGDKIKEVEIKTKTKMEQKKGLDNKLENTQEKIKELKKKSEKYEKAKIFLQHFSEKRRKKGQKIFSDMGTLALQNILGEGYRLEINYEIKRSKPIAEVNIVSPYADVENGEIEFSSAFAAGGENDIASFAMKLALLQAYKPKQNGPLMLDETFKHVSLGHVEDISSLLKQINEKLNRQFIFCTSHGHPSLKECADKLFKIDRNLDGASEVIVEE